VGQNPITLKFWNFQTLEDSTSGCYDGAILEVSSDGGTTWTQVPTANLLTDPYNGAVSASFSNPLAGLQAWCGDPQPYLNSIADVSSYAGQTVNFRFRLGSDSSVSKEGWYIDDVKVQSCEPFDPPLFADGFETGDTSMWSVTLP
jgi:bacillopeptidase F (M6 metalloprotease family)